MLATLAAVAATLVAPKLGIAESRDLVAEFDRRGLVSGAAAEVELAVTPEGRIVSCKVLQSKGDRDAIATLCPVLQKIRVREPARIDDKPAFGMFRSIVTMGTVTKDQVFGTTPRVEFQVNKLPGGQDHLDLTLLTMTGPDGTIAQCSGQNTDRADYVAVACAQLRAHPLDTGRPQGAPLVSMIKVRFSPSGTSARGSGK